MCETKAELVSISLILLLATRFCIYKAPTENKVGHYSKIKSQGSCENEYKKYCLNGGECYYLVDEEIVGCNYTWLYGGKRYEKYMWWDWLRIQDWKFFSLISDTLLSLFNENLTRRKKFISKSVALYFVQFKTWRVVFSYSKTDALYFYNFRIWRVVFFQFKTCNVKKISIQNRAF